MSARGMAVNSALRAVCTWIAVASVFCDILAANATTPLYFAFMTATEGEFTSEEAIPAVQQAVDVINNDSSILRDYELQFDEVFETSCNGPKAQTLFLDMVTTHIPPPLAVVGCGCSEATREVAEIIHHWNIPLLSYASWSAELTDSSRYRNHFQLHPNDRNLAAALAELLKYYGWKQLLIVSQKTEYFLKKEVAIKQEMKKFNISLLDPVYLNENIQLTDTAILIPEDIRIFYINANEEVATLALCQAFQQGLQYPDYVWITPGWYGDNWVDSFNETECANDSPQLLTQGVLTMWLHPGTEETFTSDCYGNPTIPNNISYIASLAYDAVWAMALALNTTASMTDINDTSCFDVDGEVVDISNYAHTNKKMGCLFNWSLSHLDFCGISGNIRFTANGSSVQSFVWIMQNRVSNSSDGITKVAVASIDFSNSSIPVFQYTAGESNATVFKGSVPPDGTPVHRITAPPLWLVVINYILSTAGIIFSLVCLAFSIVFRNRRIIKLTTPNLNYFIITGAVLLYASAYFRTFPGVTETHQHIRCNFGTVMDCVGYVFIFAPVLAKMWRVYYIFTSPEQKKKVVKDYHLVLAVLLMLAVIVLLGILSVAVPALKPDTYTRPDVERPYGTTEEGVKIVYSVWECYNSTLPFAWLALQFVYLFILQMVAIILAFKTRKVKIKALNESKSLAAIIYTTSIVLVAFVIISFVLDSYFVTRLTIFAAGLLIGTTFFLAVTFIPKMVALYRDPEGQGVFKKNGTTNRSSDMTGAATEDTCFDDITTLKQRIVDLEMQLLATSKDNK